MRRVYYTEDGVPFDEAKQLDHLLGKVERGLAMPIFMSLFQSLSRVRSGWLAARIALDKEAIFKGLNFTDAVSLPKLSDATEASGAGIGMSNASLSTNVTTDGVTIVE